MPTSAAAAATPRARREAAVPLDPRSTPARPRSPRRQAPKGEPGRSSDQVVRKLVDNRLAESLRLGLADIDLGVGAAAMVKGDDASVAG